MRLYRRITLSSLDMICKAVRGLIRVPAGQCIFSLLLWNILQVCRFIVLPWPYLSGVKTTQELRASISLGIMYAQGGYVCTGTQLRWGRTLGVIAWKALNAQSPPHETKGHIPQEDLTVICCQSRDLPREIPFTTIRRSQSRMSKDDRRKVNENQVGHNSKYVRLVRTEYTLLTLLLLDNEYHSQQ